MPRDLFAENGVSPVAAPQQSQSLINQMANSPLVNGILGAGDALGSTLSAGLVNPHTGSGTAYNVGNIGGNIAGFIGLGEVLDTIRFLGEGLPYIGKAAKFLGAEGLGSVSEFAANAAKQGLGTAAYGALTNPDDRLKGAEKGFAWGAGGAAAPYAVGAIGKAADVIRPQKYAKQILDLLGGGKNLENNAQSVAQDLKTSFENKVAEGNALYSPVFDSLGSRPIYDSVKLGKATSKAPEIYVPDEVKKQIADEAAYLDSLSGKVVSGKGADFTPASTVSNTAYPVIARKSKEFYDGDLKDLHNDFIKNPSLQNAHDLQSQLGYSIRDLQAKDAKSGLDVASRNALQAYQKSQTALKSDIASFLRAKNPQLSDAYDAANKNWLDNVVPYLENPKISKIAKGEVTNPRNITNIFANPEPEIQKIVEDMGPDAANKILYAELGKVKGALTPEKLLGSFNDLEKKGLGSYVTPSLSEQFDTLMGRMKNRDNAQKAAGALLGASLIHPAGSGVAAGAAALGGAALSPAVMRFLQARLPLERMSAQIANAAKAGYTPASQALIANTVPGGQ